jgi:hypothetical protein
MHSPSCTSCFARLCVTVEDMATGSTESIPSCTSRYLLDYPEVGLPTRVPQNADTLRSGDLPPSLQYLDLENFIRQLRTVLHATKWDLHLRNYLYLTREVVSHATLSYIREKRASVPSSAHTKRAPPGTESLHDEATIGSRSTPDPVEFESAIAPQLSTNLFRSQNRPSTTSVEEPPGTGSLHDEVILRSGDL